MKLTNLDISTNYRDKEYWFMRSNFLGAFAYWAVAQSPYDAPDITPALKAFSEYIGNRIKENIPEKFTYEQLQEFINEKIFEGIPEIEKLNHPKIDIGQTINFCGRDFKPKADYDFVDLSALARNIFFMLLRESITGG